jgi:RND superfamily putative drug exporter
MLVIFIAFSTSELQFIKQIGVGLAIAVVLDTTLIRLILLPSSMRLFGKWNWWSPWNRD